MRDNDMRFFDKEINNSEFEAEIAGLLGQGILATSYMTKRLRGVSMMGLVYIFENVPERYRYNRYDHTLGVAHLTLRLCNNLKTPDVEKRLAVLAALCHDLGHGPLSHSSEGYLQWNAGTDTTHQTGNHFTKIESMLRECSTTLPVELLQHFPDLTSLAKATYYITQGKGPRDWDSPGADLANRVCHMFNVPFSADVIDGDNRAFLSLSHIRGLNLSPIDPDSFIDAISSYGELFVTDGIFGKRLVDKFTYLQGLFYEKIIQQKKLQTGEAMMARAIELAYDAKTRQTSIGFSNLTDGDVISRFLRYPDSKVAKLWKDLEGIRLFASLSELEPELYKEVCDQFPIHEMKLEVFKEAKEKLENELAMRLKVDPDLVIAQVIQPLNWDPNNIQLLPIKKLSNKNATRLKINWLASQGEPLPEDRRLEIYIPA